MTLARPSRLGRQERLRRPRWPSAPGRLDRPVHEDLVAEWLDDVDADLEDRTRVVLPHGAQAGPDAHQHLSVGRHLRVHELDSPTVTCPSAPSFRRFIGGEPMNPATNTFAGWS